MSDSEYELDEMQEIIDEFMIETSEIVDSLDSNLVKLEKEPNNLELLNEIFRSAHTMKGTSGFLGFNELMRLTHNMEDVLNKLRKNEIQVTADIMDVLLNAVDSVKLVLKDIVDGKQGNTNIDDIIASLKQIMKEQTSPQEDKSSGPDETGTASEQEKISEQELKSDEQLQDQEIEAAKAAQNTETKVSEKLDKNSLTSLRKGSTKVIDSTIRVGVDRLDSLVNMVGELVLGRNALMQTLNQIQETHEGEREIEFLLQASSQINFITTELHLAIMKMRMMQIGHVFNKFPRVVRDLSREMKKKIDLEITGEETELDKSVIEEINDPLVHLIRNSVDHGIELPEDRLKAGKSERGTIKLSSFQVGNNIVIQVEDNGKGMNIDAIKKKAIERGLTSAQAVEKLSQKEILNFIFKPGFSTAQKTTQVSGRGVGMDVVRTNIEKLKGTIELESVEGKRSLVTIRLPLTLAIVQGLLVKCEDDLFAIPLTSVIETVIATPDQIKYINQKTVIKLRDTIIPIVDLRKILFNRDTERKGQLRIVIVGLAEKVLGLIVDSLVGQEEVVIKTMGDYLGDTPGVAGATIMGDGRVRLIIDLASLFDLVVKV